MNRTVKILEAQDFKSKGTFFYCTSDDIQSRSKEEILDWFGDAKKIALGKAGEYEIMSIEPMISFANNAAVMIKVDTKNIPSGIYPIPATIS